MVPTKQIATSSTVATQPRLEEVESVKTEDTSETRTDLGNLIHSFAALKLQRDNSIPQTIQNLIQADNEESNNPIDTQKPNDSMEELENTKMTKLGNNSESSDVNQEIVDSNVAVQLDNGNFVLVSIDKQFPEIKVENGFARLVNEIPKIETEDDFATIMKYTGKGANRLLTFC